MYPTQSMRKFVSDRLTEVAQEILGAFESKVVGYEAEIMRQRRLLEKVFTPQLKLHRADLQIARCKKEQDVWNQQHDNNETSSNLRPPAVICIKDEHEEVCIQHETPPPAQVQDARASNSTPACKASVCSDHSQRLNPSGSRRGANEDPQPDVSSKVISSAPVVSAPDNQGQINCSDGRAIPTNNTEILSDGANTTPAGSSEPTAIEKLDGEVTTSSTGIDQASKMKAVVVDTTAASGIEPAQTEICSSQSASATNGRLINDSETSGKTTEGPPNATEKTASTENTEPITNESCSKTTTADRCTDLTPNVENTGENPVLKKQSEPALNKETLDGKKTSAGCVDSTTARNAELPPVEGCNEDTARSSQSVKLVTERKSDDKESSNGSPASRPNDRKTTASTSGDKKGKSNTSTPAEKRKSSDEIPTSSTSSNRKRAVPGGSSTPKDKIRPSDGKSVSTTSSNKKAKLTESADHRTSGKSSAGGTSSVSTHSVSKKGRNEEKTKSVDIQSALDSTCHQEISSTTSNTTENQTANGKARKEKPALTLSSKSAEKDKNRKRSAADFTRAKSPQNETSSINNTASPNTGPTQSQKPRDGKVVTKTAKSAQNTKSNDHRTKSTRSDKLKDQKSKSRNAVSSRSKEGTPGCDESATSSEGATRMKTRGEENAAVGRKEEKHSEKHKNKTALKVRAEPAPSKNVNTSSDGMDDSENPFKCNRCGKVMSNFKNYKFHMRTHTIAKTLKCDDCGKMFRDSWDLKKHVIIHSAQKPFKCKVCGGGFNRIHNLDLHLRVHTGEKPYKCSICEKSFSALVNVKKHMRVHTGEKPYTCEDCGKSFSDSSAFKIHRRVHTGEKPFKCARCKKRFATSSTLKKHSRTHTGEKPYRCGVCDKAFAYKADVNRHMRLHTGEKPYECAICAEKFSTWSNLDKHKRKHTSISLSTKD